jgi:hypothetical protein
VFHVQFKAKYRCKGTAFVSHTQIVSHKKWKNLHFLSKNSIFWCFWSEKMVGEDSYLNKNNKNKMKIEKTFLS